MRFEIDHDEPRIFLFGIRVGRRDHRGPTHDRFLVTGVVDEDLITRVHGAEIS